MKSLWSSVMLIICFLQAATFASPAFAYVVYTYAGNNFTDSYPFPFPGPSVTSISGSFTVPSLLVSAYDYNVSSLNYSFTDGVNTFTNDNSSPLQFQVSTNSAGGIIFPWNISLRSPPSAYGTAFSGIQMTSQNINNANAGPGDMTAAVVDNGMVWASYNAFDPGSWSWNFVESPPPSPVPLPSSMLLFCTGLVGVFGYVRRRLMQN